MLTLYDADRCPYCARARIVLADDGQILVDKARKFQYELGQWSDPEAFLKA